MHLLASALLLLALLWSHGKRMATALLCLPVLLALPLGAQAGKPLALTERQPLMNAWEAIAIKADPSYQLSVQDMLARLGEFEEPPHRGGSLGVHKAAMWLHLPVIAPDAPRTPWMVDVGYSSLQAELFLTSGGQLLQHVRARQTDQTRMSTRTPTMEFDPQPGQVYDILIRVQATGPLILPITIGEMPHQMHAGLQEQMLQGLLNGLALCLLAYSLIQWGTQRERLFLFYALVVLGSAGFSLQFFGLGAQFLWPGNAWMGRYGGLLAGLTALAGSFLFLGHALADRPNSAYARTMRVGAAITAGVIVGVLLGGISVAMAIAFMSLAGPLPSIISLPAAIARVRKKDPVGTTLLVAWTCYAISAAVMVALVQGRAPANFWTMHAFQLGATLDMLLFLRVLGLRANSIRLQAQEAMRERDIMHSLAYSDPLTGLKNRRGLQNALQTALTTRAPRSLVAVYMLDLDGFKPINDTHGHDVGDDLLVAVAHRLETSVRHHSDVVARLGGDEFIIMACGLESPEQAEQLGRSLLRAFEQPFTLSHLQLQVGLTIGFAVAPIDGDDPQTLMRMADAAMYDGKKDGKRTVRGSSFAPLLEH